MTGWYACENPERPNDPHIMWHYEPCHGCHVAALAALRRWPDDLTVRLVMPRIVDVTRPPLD